MRANLNSQTLVAFIIAASLASTIGGLPFNTLPVLLGSLADSFQLPPEQVGLLGSICFGGYLLGTLGAPLWMNRLNWRWLTAIGAVCTALCFALSAWVQALPLLYVSWACIGFFASTMTCLGMRVLSDLPNKERAFGVRQGVELAVTAAVLFALPPLVIARYHYPGAALALAALVVLLGLTALWVPKRSLLTQTPAPNLMPQRMPVPAWWALVVLWLFLVGNIGLWAFLERIGVHLVISAADMGLVFAVLKLLGSVAAFFLPAWAHAGLCLGASAPPCWGWRRGWGCWHPPRALAFMQQAPGYGSLPSPAAACCRLPKLRAPIHRGGPSCWCPARLHWPPWWAPAWRASSWAHRGWSLFCGLHWLPARCLC